MKHSNLILAFFLAAAVPVSMNAAQPDPAQEKAKAETEAKAKAEAAAEAKAKTEAAAKAKAEREIRERQAKIWQEFCVNRGKLNDEIRSGKFEAAHAICARMMVLIDGMHKLGPCPWMREWNFTGHFAKVQRQNAAQLKKYYEFLITRASGDIKAGWITEYAALLKSQKLASDEEIAKLLASRYAVKGLTEAKRFQMLVGDDELEKADAIARKLLAEAKDPKEKAGMIRGFIREFSSKKVFGSDLADKYYKLLLAELTGGAKAEAIQEYAGFLEKYVIVSDEEIAKLLASRYAIPALTKTELAGCLLYDIKATQGSEEKKTAYLSGLEKIKDDTSARLRFYSNLTGGTGVWRAEFYMNVIFKDDAVIHGDTALYDRMLGYFNGNGYLRVIPQAEKFLAGEQARTQKELADATAAGKAARDAVYAAKVEADAKNKVFKDAEEKLKSNRDPKNTGALQQARNQTWDAFVKANNSLKEKEGALRSADGVTNTALRRFHAVCNAQERFYVRIAQRYYEGPDPVYIRKAVNALMRKYESISGSPVSRMDVLIAITRLAIDNADGRVSTSTSLDDVLGKVMGLAAGIAAPSDPRTLQDFNARKLMLGKYAGYAAYNQENYEEAVKYLQPIADGGAAHIRDGRLYETLVRAYTALGRYDDALKYTDAMISTAQGYMRSRFKQQVENLKQRAAEAK